jgi:predicted NodU family carbamoyl transferase
MKILGIQLGHNSTVALLEEGKITCAVSEEKFDNIKNSSNFPSRSIRMDFIYHLIKKFSWPIKDYPL